MQDQRTGPNPGGLCECGCGEPTRIAPFTSRAIGWVKGEPVRFVKGHSHRRTPNAYEVDSATGCWEWLRFRDPAGYGQAKLAGRSCCAHRVIWEEVNGPVPAGYDLHHTCENRGCVNPDHLEPLTKSAHARRHSKLSEADVEVIRQTPKVHGSGRALAAEYGVAPSTICEIRSGRTYQRLGRRSRP